MQKQRALVLRYMAGGWHVVDGSTGHTVLEFSQHDYAAMWLQDAGYKHTTNMAGESRGECWTKEAQA